MIWIWSFRYTLNILKAKKTGTWKELKPGPQIQEQMTKPLDSDTACLLSVVNIDIYTKHKGDNLLDNLSCLKWVSGVNLSLLL